MFKSIRVGTGRSPLHVVAVCEGDSTLPDDLPIDEPARKRLAEALHSPAFKAELGETFYAGENALLLGLGKKGQLEGKALRKAGAMLVRQLDRITPKTVKLYLQRTAESTLGSSTVGRCVAEGIGLANWRVDLFDGSATKKPKPHPGLTLVCDDRACRAGLEEGLILAECVNEARRIAASPPNVCNPSWIAAEAKKLARQAGLNCRVIGFDEAMRLGMGGLINVGKGSESKPCLAIIEHKPANAKKDVTIALVGKTMTYDTGGYSLKISGGMKGMKYDGNGGCAVLGAMLAIAALKLPVRVVGLLPTAENMVSGDSYRPDDIITMFNGVSVEVTNTDAEGRLILGDALAYACKQYQPTAIIDAATLTGGVVVALGSWCAGLFTRDDDLRERIEAAADETDERVWPLPLWEDHRDFMRAKHADIWNSGPKRDGHPIQGAAFLSFFVDEQIPWAHLDIAGVSSVDSDQELYVQGPTGYGVRLLTEVVAGFAEGPKAGTRKGTKKPASEEKRRGDGMKRPGASTAGKKAAKKSTAKRIAKKKQKKKGGRA